MWTERGSGTYGNEETGYKVARMDARWLAYSPTVLVGGSLSYRALRGPKGDWRMFHTAEAAMAAADADAAGRGYEVGS